MSGRRQFLIRQLALAVVLLAALTTLPGASCKAPQRAARVRALGDIAHRLQQAYRWKNFKLVTRLLDPAKHEIFRRQMVAPGDDLVITETEVGSIDVPDPEAMEAMILLVVRWHRLPSITQVTSPLKFIFHFKKGSWRLMRIEEDGQDGSGPLDVL